MKTIRLSTLLRPGFLTLLLSYSYVLKSATPVDQLASKEGFRCSLTTIDLFEKKIVKDELSFISSPDTKDFFPERYRAVYGSEETPLGWSVGIRFLHNKSTYVTLGTEGLIRSFNEDVETENGISIIMRPGTLEPGFGQDNYHRDMIFKLDCEKR